MILKGEKIILRTLRLSDAPRFVRWLANPSVNKFLKRIRITLKEEREWIRGLAKKRKFQKNFAIDTKDRIHIGSIGIVLRPRDKTGTLGILIGDTKYQNKGFGTDALQTILKYGFKKLNLHRIDLLVYSYNRRAIKVYKKLGFRLEGIKREDVLYKKNYYDNLQMGLLKKEWLRLKN